MQNLNTPSALKTANLEDQSYMDYMMAVRNMVIRDWFPHLATDIVEAVDAAGIPPQIAAWKRMMRSQQTLTWNKLRDTYHADPQRWQALLSDAEKKNSGRLHIDPDFTTPEAYCHDIHLQPGGYCRDELAGFIFDHGTRVFYQGDNDNEELHQLYVEMLKMPADGKVSKVLDLGCSIGQCTTALKQKLPDAEVWGIDVGAPVLRYAHMRATELELDVHFEQSLAQTLTHADSSVDCVFAYILFHETPADTFAPIIEEAMRVLRPGGTLTIVDAPHGTNLPAPNKMWQTYDAQYNCEPYAPAFVALDFPALIQEKGFVDIETEPTPTFLSLTTAVKPG